MKTERYPIKTGKSYSAIRTRYKYGSSQKRNRGTHASMLDMTFRLIAVLVGGAVRHDPKDGPNVAGWIFLGVMILILIVG